MATKSNTKIEKLKKIEKLLIDISIKIAKQGKGCLFVIKQGPLKYGLLMEKDIKAFDIFKNERRLELLAIMDGACIIDLKGNLIAYGAQIKNVKTLRGFGTRHSAAYTASHDNIAILASEEDRKVKIFKKGKLIMQLDSYEKNIEYKTKDAVNIMESIGAGTITTIGATVLAPTLGISLLPGIIIFGVPYFLIKKYGASLKDYLVRVHKK
jgi:hypothetical protein